jgi:hypothetical protein
VQYGFVIVAGAIRLNRMMPVDEIYERSNVIKPT